MAGKPKIGQWGGKRAGAGRPKYMMSEYQKRKMMQSARKRARETGKSIDDILLDIIYGVTQAREVTLIKSKKEVKVITLTTEVKDALVAIKLFKDFTMTKTSEQNITVTKDRGMAVRLPPKKKDPALELVEGGKKEAVS